MRKQIVRSLFVGGAVLTALLINLAAYKQVVAQTAAETDKQSQVEAISSDNKTIQIMLREWAGKNRAEIEAYFADLPDEKRIIADETGGFLMHTDDSSPQAEGADGVVTAEDGSQVAYDIEGPDAATVGQVKAALYQAAAD